MSSTSVAPPPDSELLTPTESVFRARLRHYRSGDTGMVPIIIGIVILGVYFYIRSSAFVSANNLTNLFINSCPFILLGMAEIWLLLLGDIDLSLGWVTAVGAAVAVILMDTQYHWAWYFALPLAVIVTTGIGALQGLITIALKVPSFIVTLAGSLFWEGVAIYLIDSNNSGGSIRTSGGVLYDIVNEWMSPLATWIFSLAVAGGMAYLIFRKDRARRLSGLDSVPLFETIAKIVLILALSVAVVVLIFNRNRGTFIVIEGMPYAVPVVVVVLALFSFILFKTKAGRYLYAIGGNVEAARRSGVAVNRYRLLAFAMTGLTAGVAGLVYASTLGGISDGIAGGQLVLYGVAAAVIGGTSLYGGRGKMMHALVGGLVIGLIYNGLALIQTTPSVEFMATGLVLLAAIAIDSLARRGAAAASQ